MDLCPEKLHETLIQVGLPSSLALLKNPTEEYIMELLTQFLSAFSIDLGGIKKPTPDQMISNSLTEHHTEMISLTNLSEAMAGICNQIFLKDFYLTDLTSPTPKKTRRLVKVLSNFVLYAQNINATIDERLEDMRRERQELHELQEERKKYMELKNQRALENAEKLTLIEQLEAEVTGLRSLKGGRKAKIAELQNKLENMQKKKLGVAQHHGNLTAKAITMRKMTEDIESKLVRSPESYQSRLKELIEQKNNKTEKREIMQEALLKKKPAYERTQNHLSIVSNAHAEFPEIIDASKRLLKRKKIFEEAQKKVAEMKRLIESEATMPTQEGSQGSNAVLEKTKNQCEQHLSSMRSDLAELLNVKKKTELELVNTQTRHQELYSEKEEIRLSIKKSETDSENLISGCQELYDKEINQERAMKSSLEKNNFSSSE